MFVIVFFVLIILLDKALVCNYLKFFWVLNFMESISIVQNLIGQVGPIKNTSLWVFLIKQR
ncbi:hypothetical protein B9G39_00825 [Zooshikella ganghwensis]|uniref:Uncharacterized protein n=1 Tax=Zooshikella ganghwensis TaxID=202772 RepID=A0A4P9VI28_9GAMM|nr:hypothetical protein B9G39_00825 [Zooshikella ganghwensis]